MPDRNTQWIIGALVIAVIALSAQLGGLRTEIGTLREDVRENRSAIEDLRSDVREDLNDLRDELRTFDERLRNVEIAFGKVDQRLLTLERVLLDRPGGVGQEDYNSARFRGLSRRTNNGHRIPLRCLTCVAGVRHPPVSSG